MTKFVTTPICLMSEQLGAERNLQVLLCWVANRRLGGWYENFVITLSAAIKLLRE